MRIIGYLLNNMNDNLFIFLTLNVISKDNDIDDYVNVNDHCIYLVKTKDNDLCFVVGGKFVLDADNEIRFDKTDTCLFLRNAQTNKVKACNSHELKKCIDYISVSDYCNELKEIYYRYCDRRFNINKPSFNELIISFKKLVQENLINLHNLEIKGKEGYVEYAERIAYNKETIEKAKEICYIKGFIEKLWLQTLYEPENKDIIQNYISKILYRVLKN